MEPQLTLQSFLKTPNTIRTIPPINRGSFIV